MRGIARTAATVAVTVVVAFSVQRVMASDRITGRATLGAERIHVVAGGDRQTRSQQGFFVQIRGAKLNLTVPDGQHGLLLARFSASNKCSGGGAHGACRLAMRLTGPGFPGVGADVLGSEDFFDSVHESMANFETHSEEGFVTGLGPGTYTLRAAWLTDYPNTFSLHAWIMTAEFWRSA